MSTFHQVEFEHHDGHHTTETPNHIVSCSLSPFLSPTLSSSLYQLSSPPPSRPSSRSVFPPTNALSSPLQLQFFVATRPSAALSPLNKSPNRPRPPSPTTSQAMILQPNGACMCTSSGTIQMAAPVPAPTVRVPSS